MCKEHWLTDTDETGNQQLLSQSSELGRWRQGQLAILADWRLGRDDELDSFDRSGDLTTLGTREDSDVFW